MTDVMIFIAVFLGCIAVWQLIRVFELSRKIKDRREEDISLKDNKTMGTLFLLFMIVFFTAGTWMVLHYAPFMLPKSASVHGESIDSLLNFNWFIIIAVFLLCNYLLFYFVWKYRWDPNRKPEFFTHSNKLELVWTVVPAITMAVIIVYGLMVWNTAMDTEDPEFENAMLVELYAKQFDWTARYPGEDGELGRANYQFIGGTNALGLDTLDENSYDDKLVKAEFHIPVDTPIVFQMRSQDVLHGMFLPHFRCNMNCVPGMTTTFQFRPKYTTEEMRKDPFVKKKYAGINKLREKAGKDPVEFNYVLMCNKICGSSHYNMQMKLVVDTKEDYAKWLDEQKVFAEHKLGKQQKDEMTPSGELAENQEEANN